MFSNCTLCFMNLLKKVCISHQRDVIEKEGEVEGRMRPDIPGDQSQSGCSVLLAWLSSDIVNPQQHSHLTGLVSAVSSSQNPLGRDQGSSTELTRTDARK